MEKTFGSKPVLTDDVKVYNHREKLVVGNRPVFGELERNGIQFSTTIVNRTGRSLLILTPEGGRFISPGGTAQATNGKCYFIQKLTLGANVDIADAMLLTQDTFAQDYMSEVAQAKDRSISNPAFSQQYSGSNVELEFRYELDCTGIESMPHGIFMNCLNYHVYSHGSTDANKAHFGRKQYADVIKFLEESDKGESQATGQLAVYVAAPGDDRPVYSMNQHFVGQLIPITSSTRPAGIHIVQIGDTRDYTGQPNKTYVHIPLSEFDRYNVFFVDDIKNARIKEATKGKSPKDIDELFKRICVHRSILPDDDGKKGNAFTEYKFAGGTIGELASFMDMSLGLVNKFTSAVRK